MIKDDAMRKLLADKVRLWMARVPEAGTQAKLAVRAKMSQSSIHRILMLGTEPELATAYKMASAFGITVSQLLADEGGDDVQSAPPFDLRRYAQLPEAEKEKIREFADFVMAKHSMESRPAHATRTVQQTIKPNSDERALVERVTDRNLTTNTSATHETAKRNPRKPARKRTQSTGH